MTVNRNKIFVCFFCIVVFFACGKKKNTTFYDDPGKPAYGDTMVTANIGEASCLIPILASDSPSHEIAGYIYNGLVKLDKDLNIVGDLAESWDISKDNLTIIFHLRKGVKWHDGTPFTAHDVLYTYKVIVDPKTPTPYSGDFKEVKEAAVIDEYTFKVIYKRPLAPALISWGTSVLPRHLLEGKEITKSPLIRKPVGTGPYVFKEWIAGDRVVLVANENYFDGRPYISRKVIRVIQDSATMFLELKRNTVDSMNLTPLQFTKQTNYPAFKREFNQFRYLSFTYVYLGYNLKHQYFKDKRVRQAISHAINKQEIVDGILLGQGVEATGPYKPDMWVYNGNVKKYEYSKEKALSLLAEAGFQKGPDGILKKDGKPFEFNILLSQGNSVRIQSAEIIQKRLSEIGITVKIRVIEWASFINEFIDKKNFEAVILGWTIPQSDPDLFDIWHSSKQGPKELNFISFENKEADELLVKARHTFDKEERKKCYFRLQEILAEEQPYTFLFIPYATLAIQKRIKGIEPAPAGIGYNVEKWYVPEEQRRYKANAALSP
ncbi:MAG: peptide-binding protein [Syntrophus sp. (in: bacteria)]|nr:peptide-binding protein [Syntrophus sp. (in: bacteria)]